MSSEWCQNKKCVQKKNQSQVRGNKGSKYYQSYKMSKYYFPCCSMRCREQWFDEHKDTLMSAVGYIDKQILPLENAWFVEYKWDYNYSREKAFYPLESLKKYKFWPSIKRVDDKYGDKKMYECY